MTERLFMGSEMISVSMPGVPAKVSGFRMDRAHDPEQWAPIKDFESQYQISTHGRVRSLSREVCNPKSCRIIPERLMTLHHHTNGYSVVWLRKPSIHRKYFVHRLVAQAFIPNPAEKQVVNHIDRDKENNHLTNLEWLSLSENTQHWLACDRAGISAPSFAHSDLPW